MNKQILRYSLSGLLVSIFHLLVGIILSELTRYPIAIVNSIAYISATTFGYIIHSLFSFKSQVSKKNILKYIQVVIFSIFFATFFSFMLKFFIENRQLIVIVVWVGIIISNYILHSKWTFK